MSSLDVLEQLLGPDDETYAPAGRVEELAERDGGQGAGGDGLVEGSHTGERAIEGKSLVDLVAHEDKVMGDAETADGAQLIFCVDFANWIVAGDEEELLQHVGSRCEAYGLFKIVVSLAA